MNSELKKQYAMRIAQANNVQMIIISYEIIETYLDEAVNAEVDSVYKENIRLASRCIEEMMNNLHYEYDFSKILKEMYLYMKGRLRRAVWEEDKNAVCEVKQLINGLKESYVSIENQDTSMPVMQNTQSIMAGMTYGRNQVLDEISQDVSNRGYRV